MRHSSVFPIIGLSITLIIIAGSVFATGPVSPPPGGYTGGTFAFYFKNIIEGDGTNGTTSGGLCPTGQVVSGFSTAAATYGLPICTTVADGAAASSLTGNLRGTVNYVAKYGVTNTGIINSQIYDDGTNVGIGTITPTAKLDIVGSVKIVDGTQGTGKVLISNSGGLASWVDSSVLGILGGNVPVGSVMPFNATVCPAGWVVADGGNGTPDLRGEFVRGLDMGRGIDTGRTIASFQGQEMQSHTHAGNSAAGGGFTPTGSITAGGGTAAVAVGTSSDSHSHGGSAASNGNHTHGVTSIASGGGGSNKLSNYNNIGHTDISATAAAGAHTHSLSINNDSHAHSLTIPATAAHTHPLAMNPVADHAHALSIANTGGAETRPRNVALLYCMKIASGVPAVTDSTTWMNVDGTSSGRVVLGTTGNVGIGTLSPTAKLELIGQIKITGGSPGTGKVLTSDSTGLASWATFPEVDAKVGTLTGNYIPKWGTTSLTNSQVFDNGSSVGIGTNNPAAGAKLDVSGGIRALGGSNFSGNNGYTFSSPGDTDGGMFSPADGTIVFATNNTEHIRIMNNGDVGIGTISPAAKLDVSGADALINGVTVGRGSGSQASNTALGTSALSSNTIGAFNTAIGQNALMNNTDGNSNTAIGRLSLQNNTNGGSNVAIGNIVLDANTTGTNNIAIGSNSLGSNTTGNGNVANGIGSIASNIAGSSNVGMGFQVLNTMTSGNYNTALGYRAGFTQITGDNNIAIGKNANLTDIYGSDQLNIGNWIYGTSGNIGIGTSTPATKLDVIGAVKITDGSQGSGKVLTSDANGIAQWRDPEQSLPLGSVMSFNGTVCPAGWVIADGANGTPDLRGEFVRGLDMGRGVDSGRVLGTSQKASLLAGGSNTYGASFYSTATKKSEWVNNGLESGLLPGSYITGSTYTYMGIASNAMSTQTVGFMDNLQLVATVRPRNVALLYCIKVSTGPGATASLSTSNTGTWMNLDDTSTGRVVLATTGNVGVGTTAPAAKFDLVGTMKVTDGTQGVGKILTSDANGVATWKDPEQGLPIGSVMSFNSAICPAGWVIADGTNGTPDLRGEFVRGLDSGRGVDSGRILGSAQGGSLVMNAATTADVRVFTLRASTGNAPSYLGYDVAQPVVGTTYYWNQANGTQGNWAISTFDGNYIGATRPRNVALLYCMKISAAPASVSDSTTWMNLDGTSTGRVTLATTGNVGIGTATPSVKLEVGSSSDGGGSVILNRETTSGDEGGQLAFAAGTNGDDTFTIDSYNAGASQILRLRSTTVPNLLNLSKNGNIGIGTDTPLYKLDVRGQMKIDQGASYDVWIQGGDSAGTQTRNLALLGVKGTDTLYLNYGGEYAGGTQVGGNLYAGAFYYNSDIKLKKNIKKIDSSLEKILRLNGYSFDWKKDGKSDIGVIAQEVEKVFPELVGDKLEEDGSTTKTVQYGNLIAPIIEAIKELAAQVKSLHMLIEEQQSDIRKLQSENAELRSRLDAIEARFAQ